MPSYSFGPHLERPPWGARSLRVCELQKSILLVWRLVLNSLTFFKFSQTSARFRCVTTPAPCRPFPSSRAIVTSLSGTSALHARYHLHQGLHRTNPCAEPEGSQPNKTQMHEMKSLGHYVTKSPIESYIPSEDIQSGKKAVEINLKTHLSSSTLNYSYIYSYPQTDLFLWLDILASRSWERNLVDSNANPRLYTSATRNQLQRSKY